MNAGVGGVSRRGGGAVVVVGGLGERGEGAGGAIKGAVCATKLRSCFRPGAVGGAVELKRAPRRQLELLSPGEEGAGREAAVGRRAGNNIEELPRRNQPLAMEQVLPPEIVFITLEKPLQEGRGCVLVRCEFEEIIVNQL